jgi:murein DD-endopeptidase MepM/ murein hydrolase activator NlpD
MATSKNSDARCVFDGKVASVTKISNTNIAVIVKHGDYFTVYSNLDQVFVQKGDNVKTLQVLGRVHTNLKSETELHFEVRKGSVPQNPAYWISK